MNRNNRKQLRIDAPPIRVKTSTRLKSREGKNGYIRIVGDHSTDTKDPSDEGKCLQNNRGEKMWN